MDAFRIVAKSYRNKQVYEFDNLDSMNKTELAREPMLSVRGVQGTIRELSWWGVKSAENFKIENNKIKSGIDGLGAWVRLPGTLLGVQDGFFQSNQLPNVITRTGGASSTDRRL